MKYEERVNDALLCYESALIDHIANHDNRTLKKLQSARKDLASVITSDTASHSHPQYELKAHGLP